MKPLYTQEEFEKAKGKDKLSCECYYCGVPFLKNKCEIVRLLNNNKHHKPIKFCNVECAKLSRKTNKENIVINCKQCNNLTNNPVFCSKNCAATFNNKIPKRKLSKKCTKCNNLVRNSSSTLCEIHFLEMKANSKEHMANLTLADYHNRDCLKNLHASSKNVHIRNICRKWNSNLLKTPCYNCGYDKHVELCHIKAISSFKPEDKIGLINHPDNIIQLCRNCHWEFDHDMLFLIYPNGNPIIRQ